MRALLGAANAAGRLSEPQTLTEYPERVLKVDRRCVAVLGGSFDPVHLGHVALAAHFLRLLQPDELRIIPAGNPGQKAPLAASGEQRIAMLERAFGALPATLVIDRQEIDRHTASYSVDTLRALRAELGPETAIAFLMVCSFPLAAKYRPRRYASCASAFTGRAAANRVASCGVSVILISCAMALATSLCNDRISRRSRS